MMSWRSLSACIQKLSIWFEEWSADWSALEFALRSNMVCSLVDVNEDFKTGTLCSDRLDLATTAWPFPSGFVTLLHRHPRASPQSSSALLEDEARESPGRRYRVIQA
jgi:hypothetical protein